MSECKCSHTNAPRFTMVTLIDGRQVCNYCPEWRHETEARAILAMPTLAERRAYLYGRMDRWGKVSGGVDTRRGPEALKALEATMLAIWRKRSDDAKQLLADRPRGLPLGEQGPPAPRPANDNQPAEGRWSDAVCNL